MARTANREDGQALWECKCECGGSCIKTTRRLTSSHRASCGCTTFYDLTGKRFGMLLVLGRLPDNIGQKVSWACRCDCGQETHSTTDNLKNNKSMSCGCVRTKHLGKGTRLYRIWTGMKDRCLNPKGKYWRRYGGRGITIYQPWVEDFSLFREWAMANGYEKDLTIDRIKNNRGYSPDNCQWLTLLENATKGDR